MSTDIYDVILLVVGLIFGRIAGRTLIYRFIHPHIVIPYLRKKKRLGKNSG